MFCRHIKSPNRFPLLFQKHARSSLFRQTTSYAYENHPYTIRIPDKIRSPSDSFVPRHEVRFSTQHSPPIGSGNLIFPVRNCQYNFSGLFSQLLRNIFCKNADSDFPCSGINLSRNTSYRCILCTFSDSRVLLPISQQLLKPNFFFGDLPETRMPYTEILRAFLSSSECVLFLPEFQSIFPEYFFASFPILNLI